MNRTYVPLRDRVGYRLERRESRHKNGRGKALMVSLALFFGLILSARHEVVKVGVITKVPSRTIIGKGIEVTSFEKCSPRIRISFNLPENRFIRRTARGYSFSSRILKFRLELITKQPIDIVRKENMFVRRSEPCRARIKFSAI